MVDISQKLPSQFFLFNRNLLWKSCFLATMAFFGRTATFQDRKDAGKKLAEQLIHLKAKNPIVYALPRGGVPVAFEFGMGAIVYGEPEHQLFFNEDTIRMLNPSKEYIEATKQRQLREIQRQRSVYLKGQPSLPVEGRCAIVVDDGIATGGTARVALKGLHAQKASRIILAVPVSARDTLEELKAEGNEVVCLHAPANFNAVGLHYNRFDQTNDDEVIHCMTEARKWLSKNEF